MAAPPPVVELERRLRWPALPALLFLSFLVALLTLAGISLWMRPARPSGLPDDAALLARAGLPDASLGVLTGEFRFEAAAFAGVPPAASNDAAALARVSAAEHELARWARRHPGEPRVHAALGALALVRHDYPAAAAHYRAACERSPHYGEGRLGWGVALGLEARSSPRWTARRPSTARRSTTGRGCWPRWDVARRRCRSRGATSDTSRADPGRTDCGRTCWRTELRRRGTACDP